MKFLSKIVFIPVAAIVVLFAIANRDPVTLKFWPLPFDAELPLYFALLGALAVGVVLGTALSTYSVGKWRLKARSSARKTQSLEKKLTPDAQIRRPAAPTTTLPAVGTTRYRTVLEDD